MSGPSVVKPVVLIGVRLLGPGPRRVRLVRLAHQLDEERHRAGRVLQMREAFPIQMDEFDWLFDMRLRRMLDPVVASSPPIRKEIRLENRRALHLRLIPRLQGLRAPSFISRS